jgi:hypothetical protein
MNSIPLAFLKWKTIACMKQTDYQIFMIKTTKITQLIQNYIIINNRHAARAFNIWKFKHRNDFPLYNTKKHKKELAVIKALENEHSKNIMNVRPYGTKKAACSIDVLIVLERFRDMLHTKFKNHTRIFMNTIRTFYQMELNILKDKQPLMLRTLRLNEENFYTGFRGLRNNN